MQETLNRIRGLAIKELLQLSRDKLLLLFVLLAPLLELLLMGNLTGGGVQNLPLAVVDLDHSRASRELITRLGQTDELLVGMYSDNVSQAREQMQSGAISAIVVVPPGYEEALTAPQQSAEVQVIADGSNHLVSTAAIGTVENVAAEIAQEIAPGAGPVDMRFTARFNATLAGQPGAITMMLGLIVYQVTLVIASQSFTREREMGTLEQLRVTPLGRLELMAGKAIPTLLVGMVDCLLMTGVAVAWFHIPVRGSLPLLMLFTIPFVLTQVGWGTLISLISRTQQQAMLFVFALAMLEVACSGFLVPASSLPEVMRWLSYISSVKHYMVILRGVLLRGAGLGVLWRPGLSLGGIALGVAALAWLRLWLGLDPDSLKQRLRAWRQTSRRERSRRPVVRRQKRRLVAEPVYVDVRTEE